MKKRFILSACALGIMFGMTQAAAAAEQQSVTVYKPILQMDFDTMSGPGESTGSYKGYAGDIYMGGKPTAPITDETAPGGKADGTSLSEEGAEDRALLMTLGDKGQMPYFNANFSNGEFYGKIKMSFNCYIPSCENGNYSLLGVDMRVDSSRLNNLFALRGNKEYRLYPKGSTSQQKYGTMSAGRWYHLDYCFDVDEGVYDVYLDGTLQGSGGFLLDTGIAYTMLRFSVVNNSSNGVNLTNTSVFIDDLFMGRECEAPVPEFAGTENAQGEENTEQTGIDTDMTVIKVKFPVEMDAASFENNVRLTRGSNKTAVSFSGEYDSSEKVYIVSLNEQALPCMEYELTFGKDIITADKIPLGTDRTISVSTVVVPFAVTDAYFSQGIGGEVIKTLDSAAESVTANVGVISTDLLEQPQQVTVIALCYEKGELKKTVIKQTEVSAQEETSEQTISLDIPLSAPNGDTEIEISVWDSLFNMLPLSRAAVIRGQSN